MADTVNTTSLQYDDMSARWALIQDLKGGTQVMRDAGTDWLPKEPKEEETKYRLRLERSFLYNAYESTVAKLVSKPFSRPITVQGELPERLRPMLDNVDRTGSNLTVFGKELFETAIDYGFTHVLIDFPKTSGTLSLEDERSLQPVFVHIKPPQLIAWRTEITSVGQVVLVSIRYKETRIEPEGDWGEQLIEFIRVFKVDTWEVWRKDPKSKEFQLYDSGVNSFGGIPLVTYYINQTGVMTAKPSLEDLAWLNLAHWQSLSDQRNILRFARAGILTAIGFAPEEIESMVVGPNVLIQSTNPNAVLKYVEHSGKAIDAGNADLTSLEERMEVLGLQPLIERTSRSTATGKMLDESKTHSNIQAWIRGLEAALKSAFEVAAKWVGVELGEVKFDIFNDFGLSLKSSSDIEALIKMRAAREITHETFLRETKRRGLLSDNLDIEQETANLEQEMEIVVANSSDSE